MLGQRFVERMGSLTTATLSCFDRVILTGYLPFHGNQYVNSWVDQELKIRRKDFLPRMKPLSDQLVANAKALAEQAGATFVLVQGRRKKEDLVNRLAAERKNPDGLIAVLQVQETGQTLKLCHAEGRPVLQFTRRPMRVLYFYFNDPDFGRMFVRLQTWFPFITQVYVNGHEWLARQMRKKNLGFTQRDNAFTQLDDPDAAQKLADKFTKQAWVSRLNRWIKPLNPLLKHAWLKGREYYWVIDQAEYSTDVLFADRSVLAGLYPRLLDHAVVNLSAQDILTYLGRRLHPRFDGEVLTDCKKQRWPGARIKHRVKDNWLKLYDKHGQMLRVETVINNPREFRVRRRRQRNGRTKVEWCPMNKGVANFFRYEEVARAANLRYLDALSVVNDPTPTTRAITNLTESRQVAYRRYAGFNPAKRDHAQLFAAVLRGEHLLHGFHNADIRRVLFGDSRDAAIRRRQAHALGRQLQRLHVRGLLAKIPRTRRWKVTALGQSLLSRLVHLYHADLALAA